MDLSGYSLEDLFLIAIKSEVESKRIYQDMAKKVKNAFLKDRLMFLAAEEEKHRTYIEKLYKDNYKVEKITLPETSAVPLPEIKVYNETMPISEVLESAMEAEIAASEFYAEFAKRFPEDSNSRKLLNYFAKMEIMHYEILKTERDNARQFEEFDQIWPMMHVGP